MSLEFYINPLSGSDRGSGSRNSPYRTLTYALKQSQAGATLRLTTGAYSSNNQEVFPLIIPLGVTILGSEADQGRSITIKGGGTYNSPSFRQQNVTIVLNDRAQLRGVTVTNSGDQGTGVWIESGAPIVSRCRFIHSKRDGVLATGNALPLIQDSLFLENGASGIHMVRNAKGEIRRNLFRQTGYGVAVGDSAAPLLDENQIVENRSGIVLTRSARPVLRNNQVENNQANGLLMEESAFPDIGQSQDLGGNVFRNNGEYDVRNNTARPLPSAGNQINPNRIRGRVNFIASEIPDPVAVPAPLLSLTGESESRPVSPESPRERVISPQPSNPQPAASQFNDLAGHWAAPFVEALAERGTITGFIDGTFRPNDPVTRAQFAAIVIASFPGADSTPSAAAPTQPFRDVPTDFWAKDAIYQAESRGFLRGFPNGAFRPDQNLTRVQAIVALTNGLGLSGGNTDALGIYRDRVQIPDYAMDAMAAATQQRLVVNYPKPLWLRPLEAITRAEAAALIYQGLTAQGKAPLINSAYIVQPDTSLPLFTDIANHWAADFIRALANKDLISGFEDGSFKPNTPMTRAQYATLLVGALKPNPRRPATTFVDVPPDFWAAAAIQTAYRADFMSGFPDLTFSPNQNILRVQVIVSLVKGLGFLGNSNVDKSLLTFYEDRQVIPDYAQLAVTQATQLRLVVNFPNLKRLNPSHIATRAEVAAMVYQAMAALQQVPEVNSQYVVTL